MSNSGMESMRGETIDAQVLSPHGQLCPACGCPVESDDRFCPVCGTPSAATSAPLPGAIERSGESSSDAAADAERAIPVATVAPAPDESRPANYFRCQQCGSEVSVEPDQRSYVCAFCDSAYVVEFSPAATGRQTPEFVIGFAVSKDDAHQKFQQWLKSSGWFCPGDLHRTAVVDRLRGVYVPFWTFSMLAKSSWGAQIGEYWYRTETYTQTDAQGKVTTHTRQVRETEWWNLAGRHHRYYSGYLVSGSRGLPQTEALQIGPYNLPALRRYAPYFLAGWACEEYSVAPTEALAQCQQEFYRREQSEVAAFLPGDTHSGLRVTTEFGQVTSDLCLLPVHVLTYRYGGKLFRFLVNGQTGRVTGARPVSWPRILLAVGVVAAVVLLVIAIAALMSASK